jgi:RNA polymerase sigma-70 factor, ECF subfamily
VTDWDSIVRTEGPAVWRTARRLMGNDPDADDCFQEAFVDALKVSRRQPVKSWQALLIRLATARSIDRLRRRIRQGRRLEAMNLEQLSQTAPLPVESAESNELSQRLRIALAQLPANHAEVFCLACLDGWSHKEIAEQLAISVDYVGVLVHRAKKELREQLAWIAEVHK